MAIWQGSIGIFEDKGSWVISNDPHHATNGIDLSDFTGDGIDKLSDIIVTDISVNEDPVINISKMAARKNIKISMGAAQCVITMKLLVMDTDTEKAETKMNKIIKFIRNHKKMSHPYIFLVISRKIDSTWYYTEFEDANEHYDKKYLQGVLDFGRPKFISWGIWEINIQFAEANI